MSTGGQRIADIQPSRKTVDRWLSNFWTRHFVLVVLPCLAVSYVILRPEGIIQADAKVWVWVALPFPVSDPYKDAPFPFPDMPNWPGKSKPGHSDDVPDLPLDVNFYFFIIW